MDKKSTQKEISVTLAKLETSHNKTKVRQTITVSHQLVYEKFTSYTLVGCSHPVHKIANKEKSLNSKETDDKSNFK